MVVRWWLACIGLCWIGLCWIGLCWIGLLCCIGLLSRVGLASVRVLVVYHFIAIQVTIVAVTIARTMARAIVPDLVQIDFQRAGAVCRVQRVHGDDVVPAGLAAVVLLAVAKEIFQRVFALPTSVACQLNREGQFKLHEHTGSCAALDQLR